MCGISLLINKSNESISPALIQDMNNAVVHRGPNGEGIHTEQQFGFGHRRLAIVDLSPAGAQPMQKENDWVSFNGMIYNYIELREELISLGHHFKSSTDTEVLLAACQQWGFEAFNKFNGMWAFAWYQAATNAIILCRDHYGIKPLYYTQCNDLFAASSEIKQFLPLPGFKPILNKDVTVKFLVHGALNDTSDTFFQNVQELKGGHYLVYHLDTHQFQIKKWYDLNSIQPVSTISLEEAKAEVHKLLLNSIEIRMRADVPIGSCLSGGIDSSSIVSLIHAHNLAGPDFATVSSCYEDQKFDEQKYSDLVTQQTQFKALKVFPHLNGLLQNNELDSIIYHQDQPFSTASHYSENQVFKKAHENKYKVMLDGQGADEYLCGYDEYFITYIKQLIHSGKIIKAFRQIILKARYDNKTPYKIIKSYIQTAYYFPLIVYLKPLFGKSNTPWLSDKWKNIAKKNPVVHHIENIARLSLQQMKETSLPLQLHSEDRNSMMFSIESRLPFLDYRLVEYIFSLPASFKINDGFSKYVLRKAIEELPQEIRLRTHKMGFVAPDECWVRDNQTLFKEELAEGIKKTDIFSSELLIRFDQFLEGRLGYEPIYLRALTLFRFLKIFNVRINNT